MSRKVASQRKGSLCRKIAFFVVLLLYFFSIGDILDKSIDAQDLYTNATSDASLQIDFADIPLSFIQNKGQVNEQAQFYAKASRYTLWLTNGFPANTAPHRLDRPFASNHGRRRFSDGAVLAARSDITNGNNAAEDQPGNTSHTRR